MNSLPVLWNIQYGSAVVQLTGETGLEASTTQITVLLSGRVPYIQEETRKLKENMNFSLEQVMKALKGCRGIPLLFL